MHDNPNREIWKTEKWVEMYLSGTRGAIPFASEQIDMMMRLVEAMERPIESFLDLGCGDGILSSAILARFPNAKGMLLDFSEPMLEAARERMRDRSNLEFITYDFTHPGWVDAIGDSKPFDVVVSGLSIHHHTDQRKREVYQEIFRTLNPGGLFVNIERVSSPGVWLASLWHKWMSNSLYEALRQQGSDKTREEVSDELLKRFHEGGDILASVEDQCDWLREIGYCDVDCYFKAMEIAVFGGRKE